MSGYVLGTPGGSVESLGTEAAAVGREGEQLTGAELSEIAHSSERVVMHDLNIPARGLKANIDHVVIGGSTVLIIDSKVWKRGIYWTLGGASYRGLSAQPHLDKATMRMIQEKVGDFIPGALIRRPLIAVRTRSGQGSINTLLLKVPGADVVQASSLPRRIAALVPDAPPDPEIASKLERLVRGHNPRRRVSI